MGLDCKILIYFITILGDVFLYSHYAMLLHRIVLLW